MLSLLLRKRTVSTKAALKLLDDANAAIHYNREILQTALDHVRQGIAVYDKDIAIRPVVMIYLIRRIALIAHVLASFCFVLCRTRIIKIRNHAAFTAPVSESDD